MRALVLWASFIILTCAGCAKTTPGNAAGAPENKATADNQATETKAVVEAKTAVATD